MINEAEYINYFTGLAQKHKQVQHEVDGRNAFFFIPIAADLGEIDNALRSNKSVPLLALDALKGVFDNNNSDRFLQKVDGQFTILDMAVNGEKATIREVQDKCLQIGLEFLGRMSSDSRKNLLINSKSVFSISNVMFDPVGPMEKKHYGYTFRFTITCPFAYTVDSTIWADK